MKTTMRAFYALLVICLAGCVSAKLKKRVYGADIDRAFINYDKNRPPKADGPTTTKIGMYVNNLMFDYEHAHMRMSIYLRMSWQDERLKKIFDGNDAEQADFGDDQIAAVWRPDIFVRNADSADRVDALQKEHLFRVNSTGHVWYVVRLLQNTNCPPLLTGHREIVCPIMFESFSYTMDLFVLDWLASPVDVDKGVYVPRHTITDTILNDCSQNYTAGAFPCLEIKLQLQRDISEKAFDCGIYLISVILVVISWLGFWIPPTEKRVFLGLCITLILSVLYLTVAEWREFSYVLRTTHAQIWLIFCLVLTLVMVLEFTVVYVLFGTMRAKLRGLCGGTQEDDDMKPKRSKCGDAIDTVFGAILLPAIFIIALIAFGTTSIGFI